MTLQSWSLRRRVEGANPWMARKAWPNTDHRPSTSQPPRSEYFSARVLKTQTCTHNKESEKKKK